MARLGNSNVTIVHVSVLSGTHPDFKEKMKQLVEERDELISQAELFRDYQLQCATVLYETEKANAQEEYNVRRYARCFHGLGILWAKPCNLC